MKGNGGRGFRILAAILAMASVTALFSGCCGLLVKRRDDNNKTTIVKPDVKPIVLTDFSGDTDAMIVNDTEDVIFTVKGSEAGREDISIVVDDSNLGMMRDDGVAPDETAGDGIYTASLTITSDDYAETLKVCAASGKQRSDMFLLNVYEMPTEAEAKAADDLENALNALLASYGGDEADLSEDEMTNILQYAEDIVNQDSSGLVAECQKGDTFLEIRFQNGGLYYFRPSTDGYWSIGDGENVRIITLEPFPEAVTRVRVSPDVDQNAGRISEAFPNYSFYEEDNVDGYDITLDTVDSFSSRQPILWEGHGDWGPLAHSYIITQERASFWDIFSDGDLFKSWIKKEIVFASGRKAFTEKYVKKYVGDLSDSVLVFATCNGGHDDRLAKAFLQKGAAAVVAFSDLLSIPYAQEFLDAFLPALTEINKATGNYYTLYEAMEYAKGLVGRTDAKYKTGSFLSPSEALIFGGGSAEDLRLMDKVPDEAPTSEAGTEALIPENETAPESETIPESESETEETIPNLRDGTYRFEIYKNRLIPIDGGYKTLAEGIKYATIPASRAKALQIGDILRVDDVGSFEVTEVTPEWIGLSEGNQLYPLGNGDEWVIAWPSDMPYTINVGSVMLVIPLDAVIENWLSPEQEGGQGPRREKDIAALFEDTDVGMKEEFEVMVRNGRVTKVTLYYHP